MRSHLLTAAAMLALAAPTTLHAAEHAPERSLSGVAEDMADPAKQRELAGMIEAMGYVLLELPIAPMMNAVAEATGDDTQTVAPDTTLGQMAGPDAERVPSEIAEKVPQMMGAMAGLLEGLEAMRPALAAMAEQMGDRLPQAGAQ